MSGLNLDTEPMDEGDEDVGLGGDDEGSPVSEGTERDLMKDPQSSTTNVTTDVVSPPVCRGGAPRREVTKTVSSITTASSSATTSNAGGALPSRDNPQVPPQGQVVQSRKRGWLPGQVWIPGQIPGLSSLR